MKVSSISMRYFGLIVLILFWIATRPYTGISIDAQLYTFQAMAKLDPAKLGSDLYLKFGSQDHFTIYGYVLAGAISLIGAAAANFWMTVIGAAVWLVAAAFLVRSLFPLVADRIIAMWGIVVLTPSFGGGFTYAQQYQSPRLYAEALVLISIAFAIRRAWWRASISLGVGFSVHPLMTLYGFGIVYVLAAFENRSLRLLPILGLFVFACLVWLGLDPFVRITYVITGNWWTIVAQRSHNEFISGWSIIDYIVILTQINIAILAFLFGTDLERRVLRALTVVVSLSLLTSFIGADLLHNLLIVNAQLCRAAWILGVFVNLFAAILVVRLSQKTGFFQYYVILGLLLYSVERFFSLEILLVFPFLVLASLAMWWEHSRESVSKTLVLSLFSIACIVCSLTALLMWLTIKTQPPSPETHFLILDMIVVVTTLISVYIFWCGYRKFAFIIAGLTLILGLLNFDQRSPWEKFIENRDQPPAPIVVMLKNTQNIYWENGLGYLWFDLQSPSYFSGIQGVGSMFYKNTAYEYQRRGKILDQLNTNDFGGPGDFPKLNKGVYGPTSANYLKNVCNALPELDIIVLFTKVSNTEPIEWNAPVPQYVNERSNDGREIVKTLTQYYFYRCNDFRSHS